MTRQEYEQQTRELKRAHLETATLRARVAELEAVLRRVREAVVPLGPKPARRQVATSDSGEPVFADEPEPPEPPDRPRLRRKQQWRPEAEQRKADDQAGEWSPEQRQQMDAAFRAAVAREQGGAGAPPIASEKKVAPTPGPTRRPLHARRSPV